MLFHGGLAKNFKNSSLRKNHFKKEKENVVQFNKSSSLKNTLHLSFTGGDPKKLADFLFNQTQFVETKDDKTYLKKISAEEKPEIIDHMTGLIKGKMDKTKEGEPLVFVMPSFPFKSPSRDKTLFSNVDGAEKASINHLKNFMNNAEEAYGGNLKLKIYSDGIFFAPIKKVDYDAVTKYSDDLRKLIGDDKHIELITLDKLYPKDYKSQADTIISENARPINKIKEEVQAGGLLNNKFCGIHKFYTEELKGQFPNLSLNQRKKQGKERAYKVIQGAEAVNNWLAEKEPNAIRFSVHPQTVFSNKINIPLTKVRQNMTPWHTSAVKVKDESGDEKVILMKAKDAKGKGFDKVSKDGKLIDEDDKTSTAYCFKAPDKYKLVTNNDGSSCIKALGVEDFLVQSYCSSFQTPGLV